MGGSLYPGFTVVKVDNFRGDLTNALAVMYVMLVTGLYTNSMPVRTSNRLDNAHLILYGDQHTHKNVVFGLGLDYGINLLHAQR